MLLGTFAFFLWAFSNSSAPTVNKASRPLLTPPSNLHHFTFGYQEAGADMMWIRAVQDFDYCDHQKDKNICKDESWLFSMLDTITNMSPSFRMAYAAGGLALTVIITDVKGATKIFDKGVAAFPKDWPILFRAAYHYLYEENDKKRAAELLIQAGKNGAPPWVYSLAGRLYSDEGDSVLAEKVLQDMVSSGQSEEFIKRLREKIATIKQQSK